MKKFTVIFGLLFLYFGISVLAQPEMPDNRVKTEVKQFSGSMINPVQNDLLWGGSGHMENLNSSNREGAKEKELFNVTFNVDMTGASGFDSTQHQVYIAGSFGGDYNWIEPGSNPDLMLDRVDDTMIFTITMELEVGEYQYKYFSTFLGYGWNGGEWDGEPNRHITINGDMEVNDFWGTLEEPTVFLNLIRGGPAETNPMAIPLQITGVNADPYNTDLNQWTGSWQAPQAIYDQGTYANNPNYWSNIEGISSSGSTWYNSEPGTGYGILVVDLQQARQLYLISVFQMFSDGKTTHIALASHPDTGDNAPDAFDEGWTEFLPVSSVGTGLNLDTHVGSPTAFSVDQSTRYIKIMAYNDGSQGSQGYIELKGIKAYGASELLIVLTNGVDNITSDSAVASGEVASEGGSTVMARGMVWDTAHDPDLDNNLGFSQEGAGTGNFSTTITSLQPNTQYYVRAYATNNDGTTYGNTLSFITSYDDSDMFAGGSGTEEDPWLIETAEHLNNIRYFLGWENSEKCFRQIADINLGVAPWNEGEGWEPIGVWALRFSGTYDGNGFLVNQLTINRPDIHGAGLFGYADFAHLQDIKITDANITAASRAGVLAGMSSGSTINNSYTTGQIYISGNWAGGLVGVNFGSDVVGCFSAADIDAEGFSIGGLCGTLETGGSIENSYATGNASGLRNVGGLVGWISGNSQVINSYSAGFVSGSTGAGGLIGRGDDTNTITHSYWNIETSAQAESLGGEGKTTLEMITENTFISWDFNDTWDIIEGESYPFLQWQEAPGDFNYPVTTLPPQSFSATPGDGMITLSWLPPSTEEHTGFKLYRNDNHILTLGAETLGYVDSDVDNYVFYTYSLTAVYSGDQESNPLSLETFATPGFSQGEGTEENPYLVSNAGELFTIRVDLSAHYKQTANINLDVAPWNTGEGWLPISQLGSNFTGNYNGDGHAISGITINRPDENHQSLFGFVTDGTITNLNIQNSNIAGNQRVAVLAGWVNNTQISNINITNCSVTANYLAGGLVYVASSTSTLENIHTHVEVNSMSDFAAGIAGVIQAESTLTNSSSSGTVYAGWGAGGLVGWLAANAVISQCYSTSDVFVENQNAGGLAGSLTQSHLDNSYATGYVNGSNAGGLIGSIVLYDTHAATVTNSYSVGAVEGEFNTGGLIGSITEQQPDPLFYFQGVYWDVNSSGQESSALGQGLSTSEMLMQTHFNSFDFSDTWSNIENVTYPYLQWQIEPGLHNYPVMEHQVTFHVDMGNAEGFNPDNDVVYITGCMVEWAEPGADLEHQQMTRLGTTMMWEKSLTLSTGDYSYKYFLNEGWDGAEWADAPDRQITILSDTTIVNTWGVPEGGTFIDRVESVNAQLFPNPANDYLYIHASSAINRIRIVDITGRIIFNQHYNHLAVQIPVDSFEAGLYVVQIYTLEGLMTRKLMVE